MFGCRFWERIARVGSINCCTGRPCRPSHGQPLRLPLCCVSPLTSRNNRLHYRPLLMAMWPLLLPIWPILAIWQWLSISTITACLTNIGYLTYWPSYVCYQPVPNSVSHLRRPMRLTRFGCRHNSSCKSTTSSTTKHTLTNASCSIGLASEIGINGHGLVTDNAINNQAWTCQLVFSCTCGGKHGYWNSPE